LKNLSERCGWNQFLDPSSHGEGIDDNVFIQIFLGLFDLASDLLNALRKINRFLASHADDTIGLGRPDGECAMGPIRKSIHKMLCGLIVLAS